LVDDRLRGPSASKQKLSVNKDMANSTLIYSQAMTMILAGVVPTQFSA